MSITSPLKSSILSEAGVVAGAAARQTEERKHSNNDSICSELGWKCVPLVVETFGAWGKTTGQFFGQLAVRLAAQGNSTKGKFHLWQAKSPISLSQCPCFYCKVYL